MKIRVSDETVEKNFYHDVAEWFLITPIEVILFREREGDRTMLGEQLEFWERDSIANTFKGEEVFIRCVACDREFTSLKIALSGCCPYCGVEQSYVAKEDS